jgi:hypothetical protein
MGKRSSGNSVSGYTQVLVLDVVNMPQKHAKCEM